MTTNPTLVWFMLRSRKKECIHHLKYMATSEHKNPCPGGHKIDNIDRPFLGVQFTNSSCIYSVCLSNTIWSIKPNP